VVLKQQGDRLAAFYKDGDYSGPNRIALWDGAWSDRYTFPVKFTDVCYLERTGKWYAIYPAPYDIVLMELLGIGAYEELGRISQGESVSDARDFYQLSSPDGETLMAYGGTRDLIHFGTNGAATLYSPPWPSQLRESGRIDSIQYVDGWYYLPSDPSFRTRDFNTFEQLDVPDQQPGVFVANSGDRRVLFTRNGLYTSPHLPKPDSEGREGAQ
jgi:hypothetical protein